MYFPRCLHQTQLQPKPHNAHIHNQSQYIHQRLKHGQYVAFATFDQNVVYQGVWLLRHAAQRRVHNDVTHQIHVRHSHLNL